MRRTTRRRLGGALWVLGVVVAMAWGFLREQASPTAYSGLGRALVVHIAALEEGRLASLEVDLHDEVGAGQIVARIDPTPLEGLREIRAAELLALAGPDPDDLSDELDRARARSRRLEKRAELATVNAQLERLRTLLGEGAASESEVRELESKRAKLLADVSGDDAKANEGDASSWNIVAAAKRLDALDARIDALELRSTLAGQVTAVLHQPGEVVRRGEPVVEVRQAATNEVIAWAPAGAPLTAGVAMTVVRADGSELPASVVSVGAGPTRLPERAWVDPRREQWGIAVRVRLAEGSWVLPEEPVSVHL